MPLLPLPVETTTPATVRERELEVGRLVQRAASAGEPFLTRRAAAAVAAMQTSPARRALRLIVRGLSEDDTGTVLSGLLGYGAVLERHGVYDTAEDVYRAAMARRADPRLTLHAARAARKAGRREAALQLYRRAGEQCGGDGHMLLLVRIGEALVSESPDAALGRVIRDARFARDSTALAVAREERARIRTRDRRSEAALRDLAAAAVRYRERVDRVRVLQHMAELLSARGDLLGAREVLLTALDHAAPRQRAHTVQRMRTVARALGDELELRRTRGQGAATLVTLAPVFSRGAAPAPSAAGRLRRLRTLLAPSPAGA